MRLGKAAPHGLSLRTGNRLPGHALIQGKGEHVMATQPPQEFPTPDSRPAQPSAPAPEIAPVGPDFDQPSPGTPAGDPGTSQPAEI